MPKVTCINTVGSRVCATCPPGYQGDGVVCVQTSGPCAENNGGCSPYASCHANPRKYYLIKEEMVTGDENFECFRTWTSL